MIRLFLDHNIDGSGKMLFMTRLIPELKKLGVEMSGYDECDLILGINKYRAGVIGAKKRKIKDGKPRVLRLDGLHYENTKRSKWANGRCAEDANRSNAIIWQTDFCKKAWKKIMGIKNQNEFTIFNGANPEDYVPPYNEGIKSPYKKNVIMLSKWYSGHHRWNKRLKDMWNIAEDYIIKNKDVCFWILGKTGGLEYSFFNPHERIKFIEHLPEKGVRRYLRMADVMLHLSWFSWCDNSLVEAICAGCIPITNNIGGNAEVNECANGIIVDIDKPFKQKMMKSTKPPDFDYEPVFRALDQAFENPPKMYIPAVHIRNIAKEYYEVFKKVLE